jgi:hypothetical protein
MFSACKLGEPEQADIGPTVEWIRERYLAG